MLHSFYFSFLVSLLCPLRCNSPSPLSPLPHPSLAAGAPSVQRSASVLRSARLSAPRSSRSAGRQGSAEGAAACRACHLVVHRVLMVQLQVCGVGGLPAGSGPAAKPCCSARRSSAALPLPAQLCTFSARCAKEAR